MKERPILFQGAMVRALLAGTKTQTRRVIKDQQTGERFSNMTEDGRAHLEWLGTPSCGTGVWDVPEHSVQVASPYGQPGDRLWVRESWMPDPPADGTWGYTSWAGCREGQIAGVPDRFRHPLFCNYAATWPHDSPMRRTPSIHMPRWASRITLEVTSVRVERLQDISDADALAEGVESLNPGAERLSSWGAVLAYSELWESINGPGSWAANPWVWVVEFKRMEQATTTPTLMAAIKGERE